MLCNLFVVAMELSYQLLYVFLILVIVFSLFIEPHDVFNMPSKKRYKVNSFLFLHDKIIGNIPLSNIIHDYV